MTGALTGITSMAARAILTEVGAAFTARYGIAVAFKAVGGVEAAQQVREGLVVDLVALASGPIEQLIKQGFVYCEGRADYARSGIAVAVVANAPRPSLRSENDLRDAMASARRIAYSTGPSGDHISALLRRWNLAEAAERALIAPPGVPVAKLIAGGEADLGFQQASELIGQPGIEVIGPLPPSVQLTTTFTCAMAATVSNRADAQRFLAFLAEPEAHAAIRRAGMEPPLPAPNSMTPECTP